MKIFEKSVSLILLFICSLAANSLFAQTRDRIKLSVDERVELLSIVSLLAGYPEYMDGKIISYNKEIEAYFEPFRNHAVVEYAKRLRPENGLSYDGPMRLAIHIEIIDGTICQKKGLLDGGFNEDGLSVGWQREDVDPYIEKLNDSYKVTRFHDFFNTHSDLYESLVSRFGDIMDNLDTAWFSRFFGKEDGNIEINIVLGEVNKGGGYGPKVRYANGKEELYTILTAYNHDDAGMPVYDMKYLPITIHELCHSYCNHLIYSHISELITTGDTLWSYFENKMRQQSYGSWEAYFCEEFVRSCVIKYMEGHENMAALVSDELIMQRFAGFMTIDRTLEQLACYEQNRDKYPTMERFMPTLIESYKTAGSEVGAILEELPKVISCSVSPNELRDHAVNEIIFTFDQPMDQVRCGAMGNRTPEISSFEWLDEHTVRMHANFLADTSYDFMMVFFNAQGFPQRDFYHVVFKTR